MPTLILTNINAVTAKRSQPRPSWLNGIIVCPAITKRNNGAMTTPLNMRTNDVWGKGQAAIAFRSEMRDLRKTGDRCSEETMLADNLGSLDGELDESQIVWLIPVELKKRVS